MVDDKVVEIIDPKDEKIIIELLDSSYQGVETLLILSYDDRASNNEVSVDSFKRYSLPSIKIEKCNIGID